MAKEPYGKNCPECGKPLMKEHWCDMGDMEELRITCSRLECNLEPYHITITKLKKEEN